MCPLYASWLQFNLPFSQCGSFHGSELQGSCSLQFLFSCLSILVSSCCSLEFCVDFLGVMCLFLVCGIRCWILIKFVWINAFRRSLLTRSLLRSRRCFCRIGFCRNEPNLICRCVHHVAGQRRRDLWIGHCPSHVMIVSLCCLHDPLLGGSRKPGRRNNLSELSHIVSQLSKSVSLLQQQVGRKDAGRKPNRVRTPKPDQHTQAKPKSHEGSLWQSLQNLYTKAQSQKSPPNDAQVRSILGDLLSDRSLPSDKPRRPLPKSKPLPKSQPQPKHGRPSFLQSSAGQVFDAMVGQSSPAKPTKNVTQRLCRDLWDCRIFHASAIHKHVSVEPCAVFAKMTRKLVRIKIGFQLANLMLPLLW